MSRHVNEHMSKIMHMANKSRCTYMCNKHQLSNPGMGLFLRKNHLLRCWGGLFLLIGLGLLHYLYCWNCLQENWNLDSFYEGSFSWGCSVSLLIYHTTMYDTILCWCSKVLLGIVGRATKMDTQACWSFTCCSSWTLGSSSKCSQLKSFL